jgi:hypothetical protein
MQSYWKNKKPPPKAEVERRDADRRNESSRRDVIEIYGKALVYWVWCFKCRWKLGKMENFSPMSVCHTMFSI